jgi:hypothetical protein
MRLPRFQKGCRPLVSKRLTLFLTAWLLTGMVVSLVTFLTLFSKQKRSMDTVVNERCANRAKVSKEPVNCSASTEQCASEVSVTLLQVDVLLFKGGKSLGVKC